MRLNNFLYTINASLIKTYLEFTGFEDFRIAFNVTIRLTADVSIELWRPITFEPITYLIVSVHHTVRIIDLSKNNYVARLANKLFQSYGPPKFYTDMGGKTYFYVSFVLRYLGKKRSGGFQLG